MKLLPEAMSKSMLLVKNAPGRLPAVPTLIQQIVLGQVAFFGAYSLVSGPSQQRLAKLLTVTDESALTSLLTFHACPTSVTQLLLGSAALLTLGSFHVNTLGATSFLAVAGMGALGASALVAADIRGNASQTQAGAAGVGAALLTHHVFRTPALFARVTSFPLLIAALGLTYAYKANDKAVLGGMTAGYASFLLLL